MLGVLADSHWVQMLGLSVVAQVLSWAIAAALHTEKFYDLVGELILILLTIWYYSVTLLLDFLVMIFSRLSHIPPGVIPVAQSEHPVCQAQCGQLPGDGLGLQVGHLPRHQGDQGWRRQEV